MFDLPLIQNVQRSGRLFVVLTCFLLLASAQPLQSQSPFDGFAIQEVPMDPAVAATIQADAGFTNLPRCWRVYVCFDSDFWELQAVAGVYDSGVPHPFIVECPTCTGANQFYQNSLYGFANGDNINPALYAIDPTLEYDSWFTIGDPFNTNMNGNITIVQDPNTFPFNDFETGGPLIETANIPPAYAGSSVFATLSYSLIDNPPGIGNTHATPNSTGDTHLLIAQLTTDGVFDGICTLAFRELTNDFEILSATNVIEYDVTFTNNPGSFDLTCPQVFLPVELLEFNAAASDDRVNLMWVTASERNSERFFVERSMDQQTWKDVGSLPAAGNADEENDYFLVDHHPEPGVNYYRLRQVDTNGDTHYSDIRAAVFKQEQFTFYPNPTSDRVWFKGNLEDVERIRIIDMHGQVVLEQRTSGSPIREMDVHSLATGSYVIEVIYPTGQIYRNVMQVGR